MALLMVQCLQEINLSVSIFKVLGCWIQSAWSSGAQVTLNPQEFQVHSWYQCFILQALTTEYLPALFWLLVSGGDTEGSNPPPLE